MRLTLISTLGAIALAALPAHAQEAARRSALALDEVVAARRSLLNDTTRFARCPVEAALNRAMEPVRETRHLAAVMEAGAGACGPEDRRPRPHQVRLVIVDSLSLGDSAGTVYLTVQRGDLVFQERHELLWLSAVPRWRVDRISVGGAEHHSYARRPPPGANPER